MSCVERVPDLHISRVHTDEELTWNVNTSEEGPADTTLPEGAEKEAHLPDTAVVLLSQTA